MPHYLGDAALWQASQGSVEGRRHKDTPPPSQPSLRLPPSLQHPQYLGVGGRVESEAFGETEVSRGAVLCCACVRA